MKKGDANNMEIKTQLRSQKCDNILKCNLGKNKIKSSQYLEFIDNT